MFSPSYGLMLHDDAVSLIDISLGICLMFLTSSFHVRTRDDL